jgi:hypothetical protein
MVDAPTWDEVLIRYGRAMIAAQEMERAMFALILVREQTDAIAAGDDHTDDMDDVLKLVHAPPGRLRDALVKRRLLEDEGLARRFEEAKKARDLLAHWYLRDHESAARTDELLRMKMVTRLDLCVDRFRTVQSEFEAEAALALHTMDPPLVPDPAGLAGMDVFDCIVSPEDARFLRDLGRLDQAALDQAYNDAHGDYDLPLPHPFDGSAASWD